MDDVKLVARQSTGRRSIAIAHETVLTPDALAKRFFALAMIGVVLYISTILILLQSAN